MERTNLTWYQRRALADCDERGHVFLSGSTWESGTASKRTIESLVRRGLLEWVSYEELGSYAWPRARRPLAENGS